MLTKVSHWLASVVLSDSGGEQSIQMYSYGCELFLYTIISTIGLLVIGALFDQFLVTVAIVSVFYLCQSTGGGYHAATHMKCFWTMAIGLIASLILIKSDLPNAVFALMLIFSSGILFAVPLCLHPNKQYLEVFTTKLVVRSRIATICLLIVLILFYLGGLFEIARSGAVSLLCASFSRMYARVTKRQ